MTLKKGDKIKIIKDGVFAGNEYKIGDVLTVLEDYLEPATVLKATNGVYGGELIMLYENEWKVYEEPSVIIDYNGYSVGSSLLECHLKAWTGVGQNIYNMTPNEWTVHSTVFYSDRVVEKIEQKEGIWAFLVSDTANLWIRADGYKEFVESASKPKVEEVKQSECVFNVGDRVRIKLTSRYYNNTSSNPKDVVGTIIDDNHSSDMKYRVSWDNHSGNSYDYEDLELFNVIPSDPLRLVTPVDYGRIYHTDLIKGSGTPYIGYPSINLVKQNEVLEFQTPIIVTNKKQKRKLVII